MNEFINAITPLIFKTITTIIVLLFAKVILPQVTGTLIPWLKEKRIDGIVMKYVEAAEKLKASGQLSIPKKEYVIRLLEKRGIPITDEIDASIESAVVELDHASAQALFLIHDNRTKLIFKLRFLCGFPWADVADVIGGRNTEEAVKSACYRYLQVADAP